LSSENEDLLETLSRIAEVFGHSLPALVGKPNDPDEAEVVELFRSLPKDVRPLLMQMLRTWLRTSIDDGRSRK